MTEELEPCPGCDGTGDCQNCDGGCEFLTEGGSVDYECDDCQGTRECSQCDGTGKMQED